MKTIIMAGGMGSRISSIASDIPKPMLPLCGKPILEYQIECLKKNNLRDIIIVTGHLGHIIRDHFKDGKQFDCTISYFTETEPLGTAGALYKIKDTLPDNDFILINGDIIFDIDFQRLIDFHIDRRAWATLVSHPNSHPYDSALLVTDDDNRITRWINKEESRTYYQNLVNSGIHILSKKILEFTAVKGEKIDLDREVLKPQVSSNNIFSYRTPEYIKDAGTPDRYQQLTRDIEKNFVSRKNLSRRQKAIFLDRDGTINKFNAFITRPEDFELIEGTAEAIRKINQEAYLAIVITNQPVIARGEVSFEELKTIHNKMETELGKAGAYLDDIFFCPHHPDGGFPGERPEYKIDCECRKPKPGLIYQAAKKYNIDLSLSYMAGDDKRDVQAAINAGCKPVLLSGSTQTEHPDPGTVVFPCLKDFIDSLFT